MENREIALKLVLDAIEENTSIGTVSDRLRLQKAIYICQEMEIPLGYSYSWYVKGPYSPSLTQDYYNLNSSLSAGDNDTKGLQLHPDLIERAQRVKQALLPPPGVDDKPHWYEALCSLHYLLKASKKPVAEAKQFMRTVKPHLNDLLDRAHDRLVQMHLV
jgi:hypothetical protein